MNKQYKSIICCLLFFASVETSANFWQKHGPAMYVGAIVATCMGSCYVREKDYLTLVTQQIINLVPQSFLNKLQHNENYIESFYHRRNNRVVLQNNNNTFFILPSREVLLLITSPLIISYLVYTYKQMFKKSTFDELVEQYLLSVFDEETFDKKIMKQQFYKALKQHGYTSQHYQAKAQKVLEELRF